MAKIFLAHAREDKAQVRKLYADLKTRGFDPWLDEEDLLPGQIWKTEITKAIRQAGVFLACLSSQSVGKVGYVQNEFRLALSAFGERPPASIFLIPVRLDDCEVPALEIPDGGRSLRDIHWVDLWQEGGVDRLVRSIEQAQNVPSQAPRGRLVKAVDLGALGESQPKPLTVLHDAAAPWCPELVVVPPGNFLMGSTEPERRRVIQQGAKLEWVKLPLHKPQAA